MVVARRESAVVTGYVVSVVVAGKGSPVVVFHVLI